MLTVMLDTDHELTVMQAAYTRWQISRNGHGYLVAFRNGVTLMAETPARLRRMIIEHESGTTW